MKDCKNFEDIQLTSLVNTWDLEKNLSKNHLMDKMDFEIY